MSKQELFNKTLEAKKSMQLALDHIQVTKHNDGEYERGMRNAFSDCVRWIDELYSETDEPELIKVKPFVADWYEKNKHALDLAIFTEIRLLDDEEWPHDSGFKSWLDQSGNKPIETLIRMKDGYEVEKEQLYYVKMPKTDLFLNLNKLTGEISFVRFKLDADESGHIKLAESDVPNEYVQFAVKVED